MASLRTTVTCGNGEKCLNFKHLVMVPASCPAGCEHLGRSEKSLVGYLTGLFESNIDLHQFKAI